MSTDYASTQLRAVAKPLEMPLFNPVEGLAASPSTDGSASRAGNMMFGMT